MFLVAQPVKKKKKGKKEVYSLDQEDPLEKGKATHSSVLAWRISWTKESGKATAHGVAKSQTWLSDFTFAFSF